MKRATVVIIAFLYLSVGCLAPAIAAPPVCVTPVHVTTPCSGVLLPPDAAAKGLTCLKVDLPQLSLKLEQEKALFVNYKSYAESLLVIEKKRGNDYKTLLTSMLEADTGPKWYNHPIFWFSMGFVVATATTVGITYAVNSDR